MFLSQVVAFEPIPPMYHVLVRNLKSCKSAWTSPASSPVSLQLALGAEQGQEEFTFYLDSPGESTR